LSTDFSGSFPPAGWTIDAHAGNWSGNNSNNAGGAAPEARLNYTPTFTGDSRLISPAVNLTGVTALKVKFNHMLDHYTSPYTIGVATRSGGGAWNIVWSINPTGSIPATQEIVSINNSDVGAADFQICWFFSGYSYNLNYWYIDNISLFTPLAHDAMVKSIDIDNQYVPGTTFTPQATLKNFGTSSETFDATCTIKIGGSVVYTQTCSPVTLAPDAEQTVSFSDYTASAANELFDMTVTTNLTGDLDPSNDSMSKWFNTYTTERDMVLLEIGTGAWCTYCPGAALGADDLIANGCSVAVIENHNGDPFAYAGSDARNTYYNIPGFPTAIFDGQQQFVGGDHTLSMYQYYLPIYESREPINTAYSISIFGDHSGSDYNLTVRVHKLATTPPYNNIVLQLVLTESEIQYVWQGQDHLNFVSRVMSPDYNGTPLDFSSGDVQDINLSFTMGADWVGDNCELVAFIQNNQDKEILQGTKLALPELAPLPVELTSFTSTASAEGVTLMWTTASEINNHGFEVERSYDGNIFENVGFVNGHGTSTEIHNYSFTDIPENKANGIFYYRLKQVDMNGQSTYSKVLTVKIDIPREFSLAQNFPNPFNPTTTIKYTVPQNGPVTIKLYDITGREVSTLVNEVQSVGSYDLKFDASGLASGVYFYRMVAKDFVSVKKMSILK
jgi:hypothetical protein